MFFKVIKLLYINPLTILIFAFFLVSKKFEIFAICYGSMLAHEVAHAIAALLIGLKPDKIKLQPYGVCLTLKNKIIYSYADEVILYLSGPLLNLLLSLFSLVFLGRGKYADYFYTANLLLFFLNLLPAEPLDGGTLLKKTLTRFFGMKFSNIFMKIISAILFVLLFAVGILLIYKTGFNASVILLSGLLLVNIFTAEEKYSVDLLREFIFYKDKNKKTLHQKTNIIVAEKGEKLSKIAENFKATKYSLVFLKEDNKIKEIKTESEIIYELLTKTDAD